MAETCSWLAHNISQPWLVARLWMANQVRTCQGLEGPRTGQEKPFANHSILQEGWFTSLQKSAVGKPKKESKELPEWVQLSAKPRLVEPHLWFSWRIPHSPASPCRAAAHILPISASHIPPCPTCSRSLCTAWGNKSPCSSPPNLPHALLRILLASRMT